MSLIVATSRAPRLILNLSLMITELCEANGFGPDGDPSFGGDNVSDGHDKVLGNPLQVTSSNSVNKIQSASSLVGSFSHIKLGSFLLMDWEVIVLVAHRVRACLT